MAKRNPEPMAAEVVLRGGKYYAKCPKCETHDALGAWVVAHLHTDTLYGACSGCATPLVLEKVDA